MRYLPWRKAGRGICGGRGGRDGVAIGMEGNGGGRDGEWREWARKAEKGTPMKHTAPQLAEAAKDRARGPGAAIQPVCRLRDRWPTSTVAPSRRSPYWT